MTRWNLLFDVLMSSEKRKAIGKAWPLFFYLILNMKKDNKHITTYAELKEKLNENPNTIKTWREHLSKKQVAKVFKGSVSMTFVLLSPYDSLVTCEQDDVTQVKMTGDPATKRMLDKLTAYGSNMSLLPVIAELSAKLENIERKIG
jgi:DNA phosphorothioation-dependent restriction protein DptG